MWFTLTFKSCKILLSQFRNTKSLFSSEYFILRYINIILSEKIILSFCEMAYDSVFFARFSAVFSRKVCKMGRIKMPQSRGEFTRKCILNIKKSVKIFSKLCQNYLFYTLTIWRLHAFYQHFYRLMQTYAEKWNMQMGSQKGCNLACLVKDTL